MKRMPSSAKSVSEAVAALQQGGIVVLPTNRWYMVCALATNNPAIHDIFLAKKRSLSKQPLFIVPHKKDTNTFFSIGSSAQKLIDHLWPGDLSLLLNWSSVDTESYYPSIGKGHALVNNPSGIFGRIVQKIGRPLAATTVNVSESLEADGLGPAISALEANKFILESKLKIDLLIDGGISPAFNHTTILDCRDPNALPAMVREGYVHGRALNAALEQKIF